MEIDQSYRIIHCIDSLGVGGAQAMMFELHEAIRTHYPDVRQNIILTATGSINKKYVADLAIDYMPVKKNLLCKVLLQWAAKDKLVMIYHKLMTSNTFFFKKLRPKIPILLVNHTYTDNHVYNKIYDCDLVVSVSKHMVGALRRRNPKLNYKIIRNCVNGKRFDPVAPFDRQGADNGCFITGRVNAINDIKYSDDWIKWVCKLGLPAKLIHEYIGGGMQIGLAQKVLKKMAERNAPNEVRLLGTCTSAEQKIARIKSWDATLYEINRNEGISMSLLESLACGVPVICSDHYGNTEIIKNGVNGYIFESREEAKSIVQKLHKNRDKLLELKESTKKHFDEHLDIVHSIDRYMGAIKSAIEREAIMNKRIKAHEGHDILPRLASQAAIRKSAGGKGQRAAISRIYEQSAVRKRLKQKKKRKKNAAK